jgi:hypothetical protein
LFILEKTVQDLAARFADGRLSTDKLLQADDEELAEMLIQVRRNWTCEYICSICPCFHLYVLVDWYLHLLFPGLILTRRFS